MTVLVVFAHPLQESINHAVLDVVLRVVRSHEAGAEVVDLYRRTPASVSAAADPDEIVDTVVLVYPTWWTAQPALLWQWLLDRDASTWTGVNRVVCVTTHGGKRVAAVLAGRAGRFALRSLLRDAADHRIALCWIPVYGLDASDAIDRERMLRQVESKVSQVLRS